MVRELSTEVRESLGGCNYCRNQESMRHLVHLSSFLAPIPDPVVISSGTSEETKKSRGFFRRPGDERDPSYGRNYRIRRATPRNGRLHDVTIRQGRHGRRKRAELSDYRRAPVVYF